MADLPGGVTADHPRDTNLIENIDDPAADARVSKRGSGWPHRTSWTCRWVLQTHQLVTAGQLGDDAGRLRSVRVIVGRGDLPTAEQVPGLLGSGSPTCSGGPILICGRCPRGSRRQTCSWTANGVLAQKRGSKRPSCSPTRAMCLRLVQLSRHPMSFVVKWRVPRSLVVCRQGVAGGRHPAASARHCHGSG
jgi:hypothetical protein